MPSATTRTADRMPEVLAIEPRMAASQPGTVLLRLRVPESLCWFVGHFAGQPILPGVVQAYWALTLGHQHFSLAPNFRALHNIKFMRIIQPGDQLSLQLQHDATRDQLSFDYRMGDLSCASGTLQLGA